MYLEHFGLSEVPFRITPHTDFFFAGANRGATGENAVRVTVREADILIGPLSALIPNSMMGEVTPGMAEALSLSGARKVMLPLTNPRLDLVGTTKDPLPHLLEEVIATVASALGKEV